MRRLSSACLIALVMTPVLTACSSANGGAVVKVTASDDACVVDATSLAAGATTFRVTNAGKKVTEVYVYASGERVVTEKENIGPGTSADATADLAAGTYEVVCKPGQTGDGIRQTLTVTGSGGQAVPTKADATVAFDAVDYGYRGLDALDLRKGTTVELAMTNDGTVDHELEVFGPDGKVRGEIGPTAAGKKGTLIVSLDAAGTYRYVCGIDDHESRGMVGTITVR